MGTSQLRVGKYWTFQQRTRVERKEMILHLMRSVQDQEILKTLTMERGSQEFDVTSPSIGLIDIFQGHLPTTILTLPFTLSLSFIFFHPR